MLCSTPFFRIVRVAVLQELREDAISQPGPVSEHRGQAEQHSDEVSIVAFAQAIHYPDAVMIVLRNAYFAETAVLAPGRFEETTSAAYVTWLEEHMIVRILTHALPVILCRDD